MFELNGDVNFEILIGDRRITIYSRSLQYIEAHGSYSKLITHDNKYLVRATLKDWEEQLLQYGFIRIHKSYLVNIAYIRSIEKNVILDNGNTLKVSRRKGKALQDTFRKYRKLRAW